VLQLLAEGKSMKEAAYALNVTADTVAFASKIPLKEAGQAGSIFGNRIWF
jgi:hypothetical protein